jgi:hypothetical protein
VCGKRLGTDFESVAKWWLHDKKMKTTNVCTTVALWAIWKLRNEFCFQAPVWSGVHVLLQRSTRMLQDWKIINKQVDAVVLELWASELERRSRLPPVLSWHDYHDRLPDAVPDPVRMVNDDQVDIEVFDSEIVNLHVTVRPLRMASNVLQPDVAIYELDELNLAL